MSGKRELPPANDVPWNESHAKFFDCSPMQDLYDRASDVPGTHPNPNNNVTLMTPGTEAMYGVFAAMRLVKTKDGAPNTAVMRDTAARNPKDGAFIATEVYYSPIMQEEVKKLVDKKEELGWTHPEFIIALIKLYHFMLWDSDMDAFNRFARTWKTPEVMLVAEHDSRPDAPAVHRIAGNMSDNPDKSKFRKPLLNKSTSWNIYRRSGSTVEVPTGMLSKLNAVESETFADVSNRQWDAMKQMNLQVAASTFAAMPDSSKGACSRYGKNNRANVVETGDTTQTRSAEEKKNAIAVHIVNEFFNDASRELSADRATSNDDDELDLAKKEKRTRETELKAVIMNHNMFQGRIFDKEALPKMPDHDTPQGHVADIVKTVCTSANYFNPCEMRVYDASTGKLGPTIFRTVRVCPEGGGTSIILQAFRITVHTFAGACHLPKSY